MARGDSPENLVGPVESGPDVVSSWYVHKE